MILRATIKSFEDLYNQGYDKEYPSIELVRIHKSLFEKNFKKLLDFGSGHGANGLHFVKHGFNVTFCDISKKAIDHSKKKVRKLSKKANYIHLKNYNQIEKKNFDIIVCMSVINNLHSLKKMEQLIKIFYKILNNNGFLILDTNYIKNNYKILKKINKNTIFTSLKKDNRKKFKMCFPKNRKQFLNIIKKTKFKIKDIGHYSFKILSNYEKEEIFILKKDE